MRVYPLDSDTHLAHYSAPIPTKACIPTISGIVSTAEGICNRNSPDTYLDISIDVSWTETHSGCVAGQVNPSRAQLNFAV